MKAARVTRRRTLRDGRRLALAVCPRCGASHWWPETDTEVQCPIRRRSSPYPIAQEGDPR